MQLQFSKDSIKPEKLGLPALHIKSMGKTIYKPRFCLTKGKLVVEFGHYWGYGAYRADHLKLMGLNLYGGDNSLESLIDINEMCLYFKYMQKYGRKLFIKLKRLQNKGRVAIVSHGSF